MPLSDEPASAGCPGAPFEHVIFDCDGVLVDSEPISAVVTSQAIRAWGWDLSEEDVAHRFIGRSGTYLLDQIEDATGRRPTPEWRAQVSEAFAARCETALVAVDGIVEALDGLGVPFSVASNSRGPTVEHTLALVGLLDRFKGRIFSADDVAHGKPAPDVYLLAAATAGVSPSRCAVVEDSYPGATAARAAGMRVFAYTGGLTPADVLEGPFTTLFDDMREIPALIASGKP